MEKGCDDCGALRAGCVGSKTGSCVNWGPWGYPGERPSPPPLPRGPGADVEYWLDLMTVASELGYGFPQLSNDDVESLRATLASLKDRALCLEKELATSILVATNRLVDALADARMELAKMRSRGGSSDVNETGVENG